MSENPPPMTEAQKNSTEPPQAKSWSWMIWAAVVAIILAVLLLGPGGGWKPVPSREEVNRADVVYFFTPTCHLCASASPKVKRLSKEHPRIRFVFVNQELPKGLELREYMDGRYRIPLRLAADVPAAFLKDRALVGYIAVVGGLPDLVAALDQRPEKRSSLPTSPAGRILARYEKLGRGMIVGAALVDSINPCAITTAVFLLSFLFYLGRSRREIALVGTLYTTGVFISYFLAGLGLFAVVRSLSVVPLLSKLLYAAMALVTLGLAAVSVRDYWLLRAGRTSEVLLQMSGALKRRVHALTRQRLTAGTALGTFLLGWSVALLELGCTGQVYLPTIAYAARVDGYRLRAALDLLLYCAVFVLPLVAIFVSGAGMKDSLLVQRQVQRHLPAVRLATTVVLLALAGYLTVTAINMFLA